MHDWWNNLSVVQRSMSALAKGPKFHDIQRSHLSVNLTLYTFVGWLLQPIPKIWELLRVTWVTYQYCRARISKITGWCDWSRLPLSPISEQIGNPGMTQTQKTFPIYNVYNITFPCLILPTLLTDFHSARNWPFWKLTFSKVNLASCEHTFPSYMVKFTAESWFFHGFSQSHLQHRALHCLEWRTWT